MTLCQYSSWHSGEELNGLRVHGLTGTTTACHNSTQRQARRPAVPGGQGGHTARTDVGSAVFAVVGSGWQFLDDTGLVSVFVGGM